MNRNRVVAIALLAMLALLPLRFSEAGGWASVEITDRPESIEAGTPMTFQLAVKQHGINPVDIGTLVITATNADSDESIEETADKGDGLGNYTVELTFPSEGTWDLQGTPDGTPPFDMGSLMVGQTIGAITLTGPGGALVIDITGDMGAGSFEPGQNQVSAGTLVVWTNNSVEGHTIVIEGTKNGSGLIGPGAAFAMVFDEPGTYRYVCGPHPNMKGEIEVI